MKWILISIINVNHSYINRVVIRIWQTQNIVFVFNLPYNLLYSKLYFHIGMCFIWTHTMECSDLKARCNNISYNHFLYAFWLISEMSCSSVPRPPTTHNNHTSSRLIAIAKQKTIQKNHQSQSIGNKWSSEKYVITIIS